MSSTKPIGRVEKEGMYLSTFWGQNNFDAKTEEAYYEKGGLQANSIYECKF